MAHPFPSSHGAGHRSGGHSAARRGAVPPSAGVTANASAVAPGIDFRGTAGAGGSGSSTRDPSRRHGRCCRPSSTKAPIVQLCCAIMMLSSATNLVFGRTVATVAQSTVGVMWSLEAYYAARKMNRSGVGWYAAYLLANMLASLAIGVWMLTYRQTTCASAANTDTCISTMRLYGFVTMVLSSILGGVLCICVYCVYRTMPKHAHASMLHARSSPSSGLGGAATVNAQQAQLRRFHAMNMQHGMSG